MAFFHRLHLGLGTLDLATGGQALVAEHADLLDFGLLAWALAELEDLDIAWTGHAVFVEGLFLVGDRAPQHQQFADVLNRRGVQSVSQLLVHLISRCAVVIEHTDLDEAVGIERRIDLLRDAGCQTVATNHDHRVQMVRIGAEFPTLCRSELNLRHKPYYLKRRETCLMQC